MVLTLPSRTSLALVLALVAGSDRPGAQGTTVPQSQTSSRPMRVWASISVAKPLFTTGENVQIMFAAVNVSDGPIAYAAVRGDTVLIINGIEWTESRFNFSNGVYPVDEFVKPGKGTLFTYLLTSLFKTPGVYRVVWKGRDFETLPIEFRVMDSPY